METCKECSEQFEQRKILSRHVIGVHKMAYSDYMKKYGITEKFVCGCGKEFQNNRYPGGPNKHGRRQIHCSPECVQKSTNVRFYGLSLGEYYEILRTQDNRCAICQKHVDDEKRFLAVDHEHVEGFDKLAPEERKRYVRGLLCILCNKHRMADMSLEVAKSIVFYLQQYRDRCFRETTIL